MSIERFIASVYTFENKQGGRFIIIFLVSRAGGSHLQISIAFTQTARAPSRETSGIRSTRGKYKFHAWSFVNGTWAREKKRCHELSRDPATTHCKQEPENERMNDSELSPFDGWWANTCSFGCSFPGIVQIATQNINFRATSFQLQFLMWYYY